MKKALIYVVVILVVAVIVAKVVLGAQNKTFARMGGQWFSLEVADELQTITQGLSGRAELADNGGMVFVFDEKGRHQFWMQGMIIDLDFLWLADNRIVRIDERVPTPNRNGGITRIITPEQPIDRVVEVKSGTIRTLGLEVGDKVFFF